MKINPSLALAGVLTAGVVGCTTLATDNESSTQQYEITSCPSSFPHGLLDPFLSTPAMTSFVRDKELVITDLSAVQSSCQASWTAPSGVTCTTLGRWTFGSLMTAMSGQSSVTSVNAQKFVANWLTNWLFPKTVNPDPHQIAARPKIWDKLLKPWLTAGGCTVPADTSPPNSAVDAAQRSTAVMNCATSGHLDLVAAPFRLSAIVNRLDLDGRDYNGNGAPGELRFVFGGVDLTVPGPGQPQINFAVIFEFHFPDVTVSGIHPFQWASMFHGLATQSFGASFNTQLQDITDRVVGLNAWPGRLNGSAISHVRTSENAFDIHSVTTQKVWEFRQFAMAACTDVNMTGSCLTQEPVSQTPPNGDNESAWLTQFLTDNLTFATNGVHVVTPAHLGGASQSPAGSAAFIWNTQLDLNDPEGRHVLVDTNVSNSLKARHGFAFSTCNGCHYLESKNTQVFHIAPRPVGASSQMSEFVNQNITTATYVEVQDPNPDTESYYGGLMYFDYNEMWRRSCELRRLISGSSLPWATPTGHH